MNLKHTKFEQMDCESEDIPMNFSSVSQTLVNISCLFICILW